MAEKSASEKRKSPRLEGMTFPIEYTLQEKPRASRRGKAVSVGESGFMIASDEKISMGTFLRLKLFIPKTLFPFSDWQTVAAEAKIVRVEPPADSGLHRYGLLITKISQPDAASLKDYLSLPHWKKDKMGNE